MFKSNVGQYQLDNTSPGQQNILLISFVYHLFGYQVEELNLLVIRFRNKRGLWQKVLVVLQLHL